jgi:hypothetical protein
MLWDELPVNVCTVLSKEMILEWDKTLEELIDVCAIGVQRVLDGFLPLVEDGGRVIVMSSGLGPLIHGYSSQERKDAMTSPDCTWKDLQHMM